MNERLLPWPELAKLVPLSRNHVRRLELAGEFPQRVRISSQRVAWRLTEIEAWIEQRQRGPLADRFADTRGAAAAK